MQSRIDFTKADPRALQPLFSLEQHLRGSGLPAKLLNLVRMRASQQNGCAYCLDMHSKEARAEGESEQRLYALDAWHETPFYSERERAALEWTEAVTLIRDGHAPDAAFEAARAHVSESELVNLTLAITSIDSWNHLAIAFRAPPGSYRIGMHSAQQT